MRSTWKRRLGFLAIGALALTAMAPLTLWLMVRDEIATMRAIAATAPKASPHVKIAILAINGPGFIDDRPTFSFSSARSLQPNLVRCGPASLAFVVSGWYTPKRRALWTEIERTAVAYVAGNVLTSDELVAIYTVEASRYVPQPPTDFSDAATLVAMIHSPHHYAKHPEQIANRRNHILQRMRERGSISEDQYRRSLAEPIRTLKSPREKTLSQV